MARISDRFSANNRELRPLMDQLASADDLIIVVGAGVSMDGGLPSWRKLVRALLMNAPGLIPDSADAHAEPSTYADSVLSQFDLLKAATVARLLHGAREWPHTVRRILYGGDAIVEPGPLSVEVARLASEVPRVGIHTTNYDDFIERALAKVRAGSIAVNHLHGYLPQKGRVRPPIILDERTYALHSLAAADTLFSSMRTRSVLFVGMSLMDTDIVQAAYHLAEREQTPKRKRGPLRAALMVAEREPEDEFVRDNTLRLLHDRIEDLRLQSYDLNSFEQVAQFLVELRLRRRAGKAYWTNECSDGRVARFGIRLQHWQSAVDERYAEVSPDRQTYLHRRLREAVDESSLSRLLRPDKGATDHLGLFLWVRRTMKDHPASLQMWASSAAMYIDSALYPDERVIEPGQGFLAVDCAAHGRVEINELTAGSRWKQQLAVPIILDGEPWHRLLVGVLVIGATSPTSKLADPKRRPEVITLLEAAGKVLLDPRDYER